MVPIPQPEVVVSEQARTHNKNQLSPKYKRFFPGALNRPMKLKPGHIFFLRNRFGTHRISVLLFFTLLLVLPTTNNLLESSSNPVSTAVRAEMYFSRGLYVS